MSPAKVEKRGPGRADEVSDVILDLRRGFERNPYGALAAAVGVGFVLGGGLFTRLAARLVGAGLRLGLVATLPRLQEELLRSAGRVLVTPMDTERTGSDENARSEEPRQR